MDGVTAVEPGRVKSGPTGAARPRWRAYVALTKPRVIELLLVTTLPVMFLAADGFPPLSTALLTLVGGTLAAAGANVINQVYDRDIDAVMARTQARPLVAGHLSVRSALRWYAMVRMCVATSSGDRTALGSTRRSTMASRGVCSISFSVSTTPATLPAENGARRRWNSFATSRPNWLPECR